MRIEEFYECLRIASSPESQNENEISIAHSAKRRILNDKETIFVIVEILKNYDPQSNVNLILIMSILSEYIQNMNLDFYSFEELDQISAAFVEFIPKFVDHSAIFSQGIFVVARKENYNSSFPFLLEQIAFEKLSQVNSNHSEYNFAISTICFLVNHYQYIIQDFSRKVDFYKRVVGVSIPILVANTEDYWLQTHIIRIFQNFEVISFGTLFQDLSFINALISIVQHPDRLTLGESSMIYLKKIIKFFSLLGVQCRDNSDNREQRYFVYVEYMPRIVLSMPQFCVFLAQAPPEISYHAKNVAGQCLSLLCVYFDFFYESPQFESFFDQLIGIIIHFAQLSEDDFADFTNNPFNYYNTAFVIDELTIGDPRSSSINLLRRICQIKKPDFYKYFNRAIEILTQQLNEGILFLLSNIVEYFEADHIKKAMHQYIAPLLPSFVQMPEFIKFSFLFLAARCIHLLSFDEASPLLDISFAYITKIKSSGDNSPISCFYFTLASEIIYYFMICCNTLPDDLIQLYLELFELSYSTVSLKILDELLKQKPSLFEIHQNRIVQQSINVIAGILQNGIDTYFPQFQRDTIELNFYTLAKQALHPNPGFPSKEIIESLNEYIRSDTFIECIPFIIELLMNIIQSKANGYENAVLFSVKIFSMNNMIMYQEETARPLCLLLGLYPDEFVNSGIHQNLIPVILKDLNYRIGVKEPLDDDYLRDFFACTTLLSRIIQCLKNLIPAEVFADVFQIMINFKNLRNDIAAHFIIFEVLASMSLANFVNNFGETIDDWLNLCSTGIMNHEYYKLLHSAALKIMASSFPERAFDILPLLQAMEQNIINCDNDVANCFWTKYAFLENFLDIKAPIQF